MRKLLSSAAVAASLAAAGCATTNGVTTVNPNFIASVQSISATACSIIPTVDTIIAIFNAGIAATATAVSNAICGAAPPKSSGRFKALPTEAQAPNRPVVIGTVSGIQVTGWRASAVRFGHRRR
jgi:hypothetical protein